MFRCWPKLAKGFLAAEEAAASVEYALLASLIAAVIAGAVATLGTTVANLYQTAANLFP